MSRVVSGRTAALRGYTPGEQPADGEDLVKLNTNENPYPPSPGVADAVAEAARGTLNLYPSPMADPLRERAADRYGVATDGILAGNGSDELLAICLRACIADGGSVAYAAPSYSLYPTLAAIVGARVHELEATDPGLWDGYLRADADVIIVCSPGSPAGEPIDQARLHELADRCRGLLIVDEAYVDFGSDTALPLIADHDNVVVLRTFSKSFSLAGVRLGLAFADAGLIAELSKVKDSYNVSRLAIAAGVAALDDYAWMETNVGRVVATRARVTAALRASGYGVPDSSANFFWMDCGEEGGASVYAKLRERGVLVRYFDTPALRGGVRVTVGTDADMDRFLEALGVTSR